MKVLLTGITGLVGASVVTSILKEHDDIEIVAVCRDGRGVSAAQRVQDAILDQCAFDGISEYAQKILSHIKVVSGDIKNYPVDAILAEGPYDVFFHCAADVNLGKDPNGAVCQTNLEGTRRTLELAHLLKVKELHYVSTAYVAGKSVGRVMEGELKATDFVNSYERSKFMAEKLVMECGIPYTIYRPSIIVGRLSDGLIRKPLAFYRILEFLGKVKRHTCIKQGLKPGSAIRLNLRLQSKLSDKIYFVPVDYVQKAISTLFFKKPCNKCYHITGESPVSTEDIKTAIATVLKTEGLQVLESVPDQTPEERRVQMMIEDLMPYFASQIIFDNTQVKADLGEEALNWKQDLAFLKRMAHSYYKEMDSSLLEE